MNKSETQHRMKVYIINYFNNINTMDFNLYYLFSNSYTIFLVIQKIHIQIPYQKIYRWILIFHYTKYYFVYKLYKYDC